MKLAGWKGAYLCDCVDRSADCEDTFVDARYDLADACSDPSLLSEICDIFSTFSDDYAGLLCGYEGAKGEDVVGGGRGWGAGCCGGCFSLVSKRDAPRKKKPTCALTGWVFCGHGVGTVRDDEEVGEDGGGDGRKGGWMTQTNVPLQQRASSAFPPPTAQPLASQEKKKKKAGPSAQEHLQPCRVA